MRDSLRDKKVNTGSDELGKREGDKTGGGDQEVSANGGFCSEDDL